jgi:hypothetical protein
MYPTLLITHSLLRQFVLIFLIIVVVKSFLGFTNKSAFTKVDNMLGLTLFSLTHTQLLLGLLLYFVSPFVQFSGASMKDGTLRYWTTEHIVIMMIAIGLITAARTTSKKMADGTAKHKRMFILNIIALVLILVGIALSHRGFLPSPRVSS